MKTFSNTNAAGEWLKKKQLTKINKREGSN